MINCLYQNHFSRGCTACSPNCSQQTVEPKILLVRLGSGFDARSWSRSAPKASYNGSNLFLFRSDPVPNRSNRKYQKCLVQPKLSIVCAGGQAGDELDGKYSLFSFSYLSLRRPADITSQAGIIKFRR